MSEVSKPATAAKATKPATKAPAAKATSAKTATKSTAKSGAKTTSKAKSAKATPAAKAAPKAAPKVEKSGRLASAGSVISAPVGVVVSAAGRVNDLVSPWADRTGAPEKVRAYRDQLEKSIQGNDRLKVLGDRAEKLQAELTQALESQSSRAQDLAGQVKGRISALR